MNLVDKSALVAEIEKRREESWLGHYTKEKGIVFDITDDILSWIDTLEVKEVDFEKEYKDFVEEDPVYNKLVNGIVGKAIAKHFFELGMQFQTETNITFKYNIGESVREYKAQKGEEV